MNTATLPDATDLHSELMVIDGLEHHGQAPDRATLETMRTGGVTAVNVTVAIWERARDAMQNVHAWRRTIRDNSDILRLGLSCADIQAAKSGNQTAILLGFQNTDPLEDNIDLVETFWRLGVRIIQLTYNTQNAIAAGCWEPDDQGLSGFVGPSMVRELNDFGILIDVSHSTDQTVLDTIAASRHPIAITHGNPRSFVGPDVELPRRNRSDTVLRELAQSGGVVGLSTYPKVAPGGSRVTLARFAEMVEYTAEMIGVDHVGIGTDIYALPREYVLWCRTGRWTRESPIELTSTSLPAWMATAADIPRLTSALLERGFSPTDVSKVMGGNFLRVFAATIDTGPAI